MVEAAIPFLKKKTIWSWQSNLSPYDDKEKTKWYRYSDFEIEAIEEASKQKMDTVELGNRVIDLHQMIQINKVNGQENSVKREEVDSRRCLREERFFHAEKPVKAFAGVRGGWSPEFIIEWQERFEALMGRQFCYPKMVPQIVEQAAEGILIESQVLKKEFDGHKMHDKLMKIRNKGLQEIERYCVFLYTCNSFLYQLVNSTLRDNDLSKIDTLGAYCHLLYYYLYTGDEEERTLYRGTDLPEEMINEYKQAEGKLIKWLAFTSMSKTREVAEAYCVNTLFIITTKCNQDSANWCKDISPISNYEDEDEVLITSGHPFKVDKVVKDSVSGRHTIYLTLSQ